MTPHGRYGPATAITGGEALVRALAVHGARTAFGIPGTHNLEIYRHLRPYGIGHVTPRHEQGAGYAADAYARVTGRPGIAVTTTGPALLNIAAAAGQAYSDSVPLLIVSPGMPLRHPRQPTGMLHEMRSQTEALRGVVAFSHRVSTVEEIGVAVARAFTLFRTERPRPVHIEVPLDLLEAAERVGRVRFTPPGGDRRPCAGAVREAAAVLVAAHRPALVLGGGARRAAAECRALAEELGAFVVTTANGKGIVDESHPLSLGVSLHSPSVQKALTECDAVLAVGTELAESDLWSPPPTLGGTLIRVDLDPAQMYAGLPADVALVGDARAALGALRDALAQLHPTAANGVGAAPVPTLVPTPVASERHCAVPGADGGVGAFGAGGAVTAGGTARGSGTGGAAEGGGTVRFSGTAGGSSAAWVSDDGLTAAPRAEESAGRCTAPAARTVVLPLAAQDADTIGSALHGPAAQAVSALRRGRDAETAVRDSRWVPYLRAIRGVLDADAVITSDSAQCCYYGALPHLPVGPRGRYLHPTGFGTLGYALPAAIGAKSAYPERQVVALSGDGGLQFTVQELATAAQLGLPLPVVVFENGGYGEIRDEMNARGDTPTAVDLARIDLPALCRAYGGRGAHAASPGALADALARALNTPGPTVITVPEETTA
ncbi:thiamine pyrophosphate-dependent enzyme [Streptomyces spiramyceticus]|uniref:thiamine pyrophosphate-dependent enzyme n=1 Tax=Streptomyces spiramyceticus TaxID=299717 RepID=UPI00237AE0A3|nr:thiamine pyrophosphate-dependent enzyme [Streptomyces spiramyceticus]